MDNHQFTFQKSINPGIEEQQLDIQVQDGILTQIFEKSFSIQNQKNTTKYDLVSCASMSQNIRYIFTQQGILEWDIIKNYERRFIPTEKVIQGDVKDGMICTAHEKTLQIFESRTQQPVNVILAHSMMITSCLFDENGKYIVTTGQDNYCRVLHTYRPEALQTLYLSKVNLTLGAQFTLDSKHIIISTASKPLSLWNWAQSDLIALYGHPQLENSRFYLKPSLLYKNGIPNKIINASQDGYVGIFDFLHPENQPIIEKLQDNTPVRFVVEQDIMYTFNPNSSQVNVYNINL